MGNVLIAGILLVIIVLAAQRTRKHFKGAGM